MAFVEHEPVVVDPNDYVIYDTTLQNIANSIRSRARISGGMQIESDNPDLMTFQKALKEKIVVDGFDLDHGYGGIIEDFSTPIFGTDSLYAAYSGNAGLNAIPYVTKKKTMTNMRSAFNGCSNLYGSPSCAAQISDASYAYRNCRNLTGSPVIENSVNKFRYDKDTDTWYEYSLHGAYNVSGMYQNCVNLTGNAEFGGVLTQDLSYLYDNCYKLDGTSFYLSMQAPPLVYPKNLAYMMNNCTNYKAKLDPHSPAFKYVEVSSFIQTFNNCSNLTGEPIAFSGTYTSMAQTYRNCKNLTGNGCCGPLVTSMSRTFDNCYNLNGCAVIGDSVIGAGYAYANCRNIKSAEIRSSTVTDIGYAFYNCFNLKGSIILQNVITEDADSAFRNCSNLQGIYFPGDRLADTAKYYNAFVRSSPTSKLNIVFNNRATLVNMRKVNMTGCTMSEIEETDETIKLPLVSWAGTYVTGNKDYQVKAKCYNEEYKLYMYSTD